MTINRSGDAFQAFLNIVDIMQMDTHPVHLQGVIDVLRDRETKAVCVVRWIEECVREKLFWFDTNTPQMAYVDPNKTGPGQLMTVHPVRLFLTQTGVEEYTYVKKGHVLLHNLLTHKCQ